MADDPLVFLTFDGILSFDDLREDSLVGVRDDALVDLERERATVMDVGFFASFFWGDDDLTFDLDMDREAFEDLEDLEDLEDAAAVDFERSFRGSSSLVFERPRAADDERFSDDAGALARAFLEEVASAEDERLDLATDDFLVLDDAFDFEADEGETTLFFAFFFDLDEVLAAAVILAAAAAEIDFDLPLVGFFLLIELFAMVYCCC